MTSAATAKIAKGTLPKRTVALTGHARTGDTLTATVKSSHVPGTRTTYRWLRGRNPIHSAVHRKYRAHAADVGRYLRVRVTRTATGYKTAVTTSRRAKVTRSH